MSGRDNANGDVIIKAINSGADGVSATLNVLGVDRIGPTALKTVLKSAGLSDNNSLDEPESRPVATVVKNVEGQFTRVRALLVHGSPSENALGHASEPTPDLSQDIAGSLCSCLLALDRLPYCEPR